MRPGGTPLERHSQILDGIFYRMKALAEAKDVLSPAHAPEGRSHRDGQRALYLSETPEGCRIATARYTDGTTPIRGIFPLLVADARVVDLRDKAATTALGIDVTHRAAEWQKIRARGLPSPTWEIADRVRKLGLDGMLYASRSDPSKTHLTLFSWNEPGTNSTVERAGAPLPEA